MDDNWHYDRKKNLLVVIIGLVIIFVIFLSTVNLSYPFIIQVIFIVLIVLLFIHGPLISLIYALIVTYLDKRGVPTNHLLRDALQKMPILFRLTGIMGLAASLHLEFAYNMGVFYLLFAPFMEVGSLL